MKTKLIVLVSLLVVSVGVAVLVLSWQGIGQVAKAQEHKTIWCNPGNTGTEDGLIKATGYKTLWTAMSKMVSGDKVIIADGNWLGYPNMNIYMSHCPPSGTEGAYSRIYAETDWEVRLASIYFDSRSYIEIRGIVFDSRIIPTTRNVTNGHHTKFIRCGFLQGKIPGNQMCFGIGGTDVEKINSHHNLMEECIFWGGGRYMLLSRLSKYNVFRRCVIRHDNQEHSGGQDDGMFSNFRDYSCETTIYQNCISIDSDRIEYYNNGVLQGEVAGFWTQVDAQLEGCISIKDIGMSYFPNGSADHKNCVALSLYKNNYSGLNSFILGNNQNVDHVVSVENFLGMDALETNQHGLYNMRPPTFTATNSIIKDVTGYGNYAVDDSYINHFNAGSGTWGTGATTYDPQQNGLLYPVRIEAGSPLATAGSDGGRVGAEILYQIGRDEDGDGISGLLYGEPGWDELQDGKDGRALKPLWPFPNEDKIKILMSDTVEGVSGIYGFTAYQSPFGSPNTLTSYIWEYLGNKIPCEVYGTCSQPQPEPQTCSQAGGTCQANACDTYDTCVSLTGTCSSGSCCSGACAAIPAPTPSITLTKSADKTEASSGDEITYTIAYQNTGIGNATDVVIADPIPTGATYVAGSASSGGTLSTSSGQATLTWNIGSVVTGASGSMSFRVRVD